MRLESFGVLLPRLFHTAQALNRAQREKEARERAEWQNYYMSIMGPSGQLGDGHLAELPELEKAGLLDANGLFLGAFKGKMLFFAGDGQLRLLAGIRAQPLHPLGPACDGFTVAHDHQVPRLQSCGGSGRIRHDLRQSRRYGGLKEHQTKLLK